MYVSVSILEQLNTILYAPRQNRVSLKAKMMDDDILWSRLDTSPKVNSYSRVVVGIK